MEFIPTRFKPKREQGTTSAARNMFLLSIVTLVALTPVMGTSLSAQTSPTSTTTSADGSTATVEQASEDNDHEGTDLDNAGSQQPTQDDNHVTDEHFETGSQGFGPMSFVGQARRVARRTARRTSRRLGFGH